MAAAAATLTVILVVGGHDAKPVANELCFKSYDFKYGWDMKLHTTLINFKELHTYSI